MTPKERAEMQQALEALEIYGEHAKDCPQYPTYTRPQDYPKCDCGFEEAITALREALAEQEEQEPVGRWNWNEAKFEWLTKFDYHKHHMTPLYAAPQPLKQEPDDLDWITPEAVFEAKLKLHGIPNPPVQQVDLTELLGIMVGMANYIDKLGGDSKGFRAVIAADREKNK